jgi:hypothetical protein
MSTNSIAKQIASELDSVRQHLGTFKSNTTYLNDAKSHIDTAVKTLKDGENNLVQKVAELNEVLKTLTGLKSSSEDLIGKIDGVDFPERLSGIEATVRNTIAEIENANASTVKQIAMLTREITEADISGNFLKLKTVVDNSAESNALIADTITKQDMPKRIEEFGGKIETLIQEGIEELEISNLENSADMMKIIKDLNFPIRMDKLDASVVGIQASVMNLINKSDHLERSVRDEFKVVAQLIKDLDKGAKTRHIILIVCIVIIAFGIAAGFLLLSGSIR